MQIKTHHCNRFRLNCNTCDTWLVLVVCGGKKASYARRRHETNCGVTRFGDMPNPAAEVGWEKSDRSGRRVSFKRRGLGRVSVGSEGRDEEGKCASGRDGEGVVGDVVDSRQSCESEGGIRAEAKADQPRKGVRSYKVGSQGSLQIVVIGYSELASCVG